MTSLSLLDRSAAKPLPEINFRSQPYNIEAEQSILGAILVNNEAYNRVGEFLLSEHFYEPIHQRIYESLRQRVINGQLADYKTLFHLFETAPALAELDGARYLQRLAAAAEAIVNAEQYGRIIHDLALKRGLIRIGEETVNKAFDRTVPESGAEQIEEAEKQLFKLAEQAENRGGFRGFSTVLAGAVKTIESAWSKAGRVVGVPTRMDSLDDKLGGLQPSDLLILAGRPSMGKTALAVSIAANSAATEAPPEDRGQSRHKNYVVAIFSLEMSAEQLATRLLSSESGVPSDELRRGQLDADGWEKVVDASQRLGRMSLFIDDTPALSVAGLRTRARQLKRREGALALVVVDYLQLVRGTVANQTNRVQEVSEVTQGLKALAKELHVPVMALSQLSRAVEQREDKRPMLSDLRESGSIEQDADVVMFVFREEYYLSRTVPIQKEGEAPDRFQQRFQEWMQRCENVHNKADVIIAKQRNGPIGNVQLQFDAAFGRFRNLENQSYTDSYY